MLKYQIMHTEEIVTQYYLILEVAGSSFAISIEAGLPNIVTDSQGFEGYPRINVWGSNNEVKQDGCFEMELRQHIYHHSDVSAGENDRYAHLHFNASHCSSVYGSSNTVTPLSLSTSYILKY